MIMICNDVDEFHVGKNNADYTWFGQAFRLKPSYNDDDDSLIWSSSNWPDKSEDWTRQAPTFRRHFDQIYKSVNL